MVRGLEGKLETKVAQSSKPWLAVRSGRPKDVCKGTLEDEDDADSRETGWMLVV